MANRDASPATRHSSFPKSRRLLQAKEFQHVFDKVDCKHNSRHFTFLSRSRTPAHTETRLGLAISKRNVPLAVARNRIKRIVREVFRMQLVETTLPPFDVIVLARSGARSLSSKDLHQELNVQWKALISKRSKL